MQIRYYFCFHLHIKCTNKFANRLASIFFPIKIYAEQIALLYVIYSIFFQGVFVKMTYSKFRKFNFI